MNRLHAVLPTPVKKYVWNMKYAVLGYPHFVAPTETVEYLSKQLTSDASVLDLGCGRGSLLWALRAAGWSGSYCGVDISKTAINEARKLADQRSSWIVSDFESFRSPFQWDIVALVESLCYVKRTEIPRYLTTLAEMLVPQGRLVIRLHDLRKFKEYMDEVYRLFPNAEKMGSNLVAIPASIKAAL